MFEQSVSPIGVANPAITRGHRTAAVWVPDWPVLAAMANAQVPTHEPAVVLHANRVLAASAAARALGVRRGITKRAAQQLVPELAVLRADPARDARRFEPVAQAVEQIVAGIEILRPGLILLNPAGAARYHGSEEALVQELVEAVAEAGFEAQSAIADGLLVPILLARDLMTSTAASGPTSSTRDSGADVAIPLGTAKAFLASRPTADLLVACADPTASKAVADLISVWDRLGIRTLGALADLPQAAITSRFGELGFWAWRLAQGADFRPAAKRRIETDLQVETEVDPPALRVDVATFAARRLANELHAALTARGVACGLLRITARTEDGTLERLWRMNDAAVGGLSPARITDRVRWQLEGWLTSAQAERLSDADGQPAPITHLALRAEEVFAAGTHQPSLWGSGAGEDVRAQRALERVQGLLGADGVQIASLQGGHLPSERIHLASYGEQSEVDRPLDRPWPGALPAPAPASVLVDPPPVQLLADDGRVVGFDNETQTLAASPTRLTIEPTDSAAPINALVGCHDVADWAGPWPLPRRWWLGEAPRACLQVLLTDGAGLLLSTTTDGWQLDAVYD